MSKRYFYSDPLAAAWKARHFGMKFDSSENSFYLTGAGSPISFYPSKYYVHADSLPLLEPTAGDLVSNIGAAGWLVLAIDGDCLDVGNGMQAAKGEVEIIRRNGLAFYWPERHE